MLYPSAQRDQQQGQRQRVVPFLAKSSAIAPVAGSGPRCLSPSGRHPPRPVVMRARKRADLGKGSPVARPVEQPPITAGECRWKKLVNAYTLSSAKTVNMTLSSARCNVDSCLTPGPSPLRGEGCFQSTINATPLVMPRIRFRAAPPLHKMERGLGGEASQTGTHTQARAIPVAC